MLALEHGEPLDEAVYCEVMFDKTISGEVPEHRDFIYHTAIPKLERMGVKVRVLCAEKTYVDLFTGTVTRGPKKGMLRAFPICGRCYVQRDCKIRPFRQYQRTLPPDTVQYIGIAYDEWERSMNLQTGAGAGFVPMAKRRNCAIFMTITRTSGQGCWNYRRFLERCLKSSTERNHSRILTNGSVWRTHKKVPVKRRHKEGVDENEQQKI